MSVYIGDVQTFAGVIADKPQVLKIGEEVMEVFSAWEDYKYAPEFRKEALIAEIADVIQAACNLLAAIGVDDMRQPMQVCYVRNKERGREYSSSDDMDSAVYVQKCTNKSCRQYADQGERAELPDCESDSREKLEADVRGYVSIRLSSGQNKDGVLVSFGKILEWLDRQAAITKSECANFWQEIAEDRDKARIERDELQEALNAATGKWAKAEAENRELQAECDAWYKRFIKANREKCDLQSRGEQQRLNNLLNRLREKGVIARWDDSRSDYMVLLNNCDTTNELKAENEALKARIESLRSKLSKMLDAASEIQHIGDLP